MGTRAVSTAGLLYNLSADPLTARRLFVRFCSEVSIAAMGHHPPRPCIVIFWCPR